MDPHSRRAQYNQRPPKAGPELHNLRQVGFSMDTKLATTFDSFRKPGSGSMSSSPPRSRASSFSLSGATHKEKGKGKEKDTGRTSLKSASIEESEAGIAGRPIASNSRVRRDEKYRRDMYLAFVDNAISQKAQGVSEHYDELDRQFLPSGQQNQGSQRLGQNKPSANAIPPLVQSQELRAYLSALQHVVSKLDRSHSALVDAVVGVPWSICDSALAQAYTTFAGVLVSARPEYLGKVLEATVQGLTYQSTRKALDVASTNASITRRTVYARVHSLLAHLRDVVPTLPAPLFPLLARAFPHRRERLAEHVTYLRNLLQVTEYVPELWERVLGLVVDRAIQIDVEIQVEIEELEAAGAAEEAEEMFQLDIFDTVIGQEGGDPDDDDDDSDDDEEGLSDISSEAGSVYDENDEKQEEPMHVKHVQDMVAKLDSILEVIFKHLDRLRKDVTPSSPNSRSSSPALPSLPPPIDNADELPISAPTLARTLSQRHALTESHFYALLAIFKRTILRTFKSRYTQFLMFWYSSLDDTFRDCFLGALVAAALLEPSQPVVTRTAAASYLASYVSRAAFVGREETQSVVRVLCDFLAAHLRSFDELAGAPPTSAGTLVSQQSTEHAVFYAIAQSMFLIFCFRWRDLKEDTGEDEPDEYGDSTGTGGAHGTWFQPLLVMKRVVNSPLNPLKVCSANVVQQFARVAQRVDFVYCFSILEANRRADYAADTKRVAAVHAAAAASFDAELTTFFPFDPFRLPRSSAFIDGIYREWTSVALDESGDEDEDESEEEEEEGGGVGSQQSDEDLYMHGPASLIEDTAGLGASFGGMSISPVRHTEVSVQ